MKYYIARSSINHSEFAVHRSDGCESKSTFKFADSRTKLRNVSKIKNWVESAVSDKPTWQDHRAQQQAEAYSH